MFFRLFKFYFIFLGFVSAYALSGWTPIPMILSACLLILLFLTIIRDQKLKLSNNSISITILFLIACTAVVSLLFQNFNIGYNLKGITHMLSYLIIPFMYYLVIHFSLIYLKLDINYVYKLISGGVIFVSLFTLVEFISKNFLYINFDSFVYRPTVGDYIPLYSFGGRLLYRARGTAEESGHLAMYLLMFLPFTFYYYKSIKRSKLKLLLSTLLIISATIVTFSAAGLFEFAIALFVTLVLYMLSRPRKRIRVEITRNTMLIIPLVLFSSIVIGLFILYSNVHISLGSISEKISFSDNSSSAQSRLSRWSDAFDLIKEQPLLGGGPGVMAIMNGTGSTSVYVEVLADLGLIGLILFLGFMLYHLRMCFKIKGNLTFVYLFSFVIMFVHYFVISGYWFPWMWTLFAIINYTYAVQRAKVPSKKVSEKASTNKLKERTL